MKKNHFEISRAMGMAVSNLSKPVVIFGYKIYCFHRTFITIDYLFDLAILINFCNIDFETEDSSISSISFKL